MNRDYSTISPSARALLMMKGYTNIPFARDAAELITYPDKYIPDFENKDFRFWARTAHFESRYWSINQLLQSVTATNILELSSGFSLRGLDEVIKKDVYYIDTDLPEVVDQKIGFIDSVAGARVQLKGKMELLPLNALDENQFIEIVGHFPAGEVIIVNEGLLMYLDKNEKEKLCSIIHKILREHGGYWITADIYIKSEELKKSLAINDKLEKFFEQHHVEENKFESFEGAEAFFNKNGFVIDKETEPDYSNLVAVGYMLKAATPEQINALKGAAKMHSTWRLKIQ